MPRLSVLQSTVTTGSSAGSRPWKKGGEGGGGRRGSPKYFFRPSGHKRCRRQYRYFFYTGPQYGKRVWVKNYFGSRWTNSISATLSLAYLSQVLEEIRFKLTQTVRPVNVIQVVLVTIVRVVLIQRDTVLRLSSDDLFWYFIRWPDLRREFLGYSKQS